jgi:hypothetical protein
MKEVEIGYLKLDEDVEKALREKVPKASRKTKIYMKEWD